MLLYQSVAESRVQCDWYCSSASQVCLASLQQPSYLLIATPRMNARHPRRANKQRDSVGKGAERVLKPLGGWSATEEVGRPPFSVDHRNYTTLIYGSWRKIGVIAYTLVPKPNRVWSRKWAKGKQRGSEGGAELALCSREGAGRDSEAIRCGSAGQLPAWPQDSKRQLRNAAIQREEAADVAERHGAVANWAGWCGSFGRCAGGSCRAPGLSVSGAARPVGLQPSFNIGISSCLPQACEGDLECNSSCCGKAQQAAGDRAAPRAPEREAQTQLPGQCRAALPAHDQIAIALGMAHRRTPSTRPARKLPMLGMPDVRKATPCGCGRAVRKCGSHTPAPCSHVCSPAAQFPASGAPLQHLST
eukprot:364000-Chlamydomonas_euryale.AAC.3